MSIVSEISRIESAVSVIKTKTAQLGLSKPGGGTISAADKVDVQASAINAITKGSAVNTTLNAVTTAVTIPAGYYGSNSTVSVVTSTISSVTLSGKQQTLSCANKLMTTDIVIPAANVYTTGSQAPTSSTPGNDGDLYLVV